MKKIIKQIFYLILDFYHSLNSKNEIQILINTNYHTLETINELKNRFDFYFKDKKIKLKVKRSNKTLLYLSIFNNKITLYYGFDIDKLNKLRKFHLYNIDFNKNPEDGWNWHLALTNIEFSKKDKIKIVSSKHKIFKEYINSLPNKNKVYAIGTGPSLEKAINLNWNDGYTIVCNTIVKDCELWKHINPDFIVAGDAIYHFGNNEFAESFIKDLKHRLRETNTHFIYPFIFHAYLSIELKEFEEKLIPIPIINDDLDAKTLVTNFNLPGNLGNVLNLLLLPVALTLSKNIFLFGFDGRAPKDKLFWSNSNKHTYSNKLQSIIDKHPCFFEHHVPKNKESNYVNNVHGDKLDENLSNLENKGWKIIMMHKTYTETLAKRIAN